MLRVYVTSKGEGLLQVELRLIAQLRVQELEAKLGKLSHRNREAEIEREIRRLRRERYLNKEVKP